LGTPGSSLSGVCRLVKPCTRCAITATDQRTGARGVEPLATLASYRRVPRGVLFGQNLVHAAPGQVAVGDPVCVMRDARSTRGGGHGRTTRG
jgi:uncharacterized protein YcbX